MGPKAPRVSTVRRLFAVSMNRCAFPGCAQSIVDVATGKVSGEICHINASKPDGLRYDPDQTDEERHGFDNLLLLCGPHHKVIDDPANLDRYSAGQLRSFKSSLEQIARDRSIEAPVLSEDQMAALIETAAHYGPDSIHMDFKQAVFKVGGEGGGFGGGGGGGGVLTIVGTTKIPEGARAELNGEDGRAPGAGGGGGGVVQCVGRNVDSDDLARGLRVSSVAVANAATIQGGVFNALGGGWTYLPVPHEGVQAAITLLVVLELGAVEVDTLLRINVELLQPDGVVSATASHDVSVLPGADLVRRSVLAFVVPFAVKAFGIWTARVASAHLELARLPFECRQGAFHKLV